MGMLVLLSVGGMGMFLLVILLAFLAAKLAAKNTREEDMEGIMEAEEDEYNQHFDSLDNERAIFIIDERSKLNTPDIVNDRMISENTEQNNANDKNTENMDNKHSKLERLMKTFKILRFLNRWIEII